MGVPLRAVGSRAHFTRRCGSVRSRLGSLRYGRLDAETGFDEGRTEAGLSDQGIADGGVSFKCVDHCARKEGVSARRTSGPDGVIDFGKFLQELDLHEGSLIDVAFPQRCPHLRSGIAMTKVFVFRGRACLANESTDGSIVIAPDVMIARGESAVRTRVVQRQVAVEAMLHAESVPNTIRVSLPITTSEVQLVILRPSRRTQRRCFYGRCEALGSSCETGDRHRRSDVLRGGVAKGGAVGSSVLEMSKYAGDGMRRREELTGVRGVEVLVGRTETFMVGTLRDRRRDSVKWGKMRRSRGGFTPGVHPIEVRRRKRARAHVRVRDPHTTGEDLHPLDTRHIAGREVRYASRITGHTLEGSVTRRRLGREVAGGRRRSGKRHRQEVAESQIAKCEKQDKGCLYGVEALFRVTEICPCPSDGLKAHNLLDLVL
ncbi:hypothetical protein C8J57DRAFT_1320341 [Mycena rebaudengoi]|nr:hypothetical protein C8J57DRAFT_1320341 [Mycena rebaudengoi]